MKLLRLLALACVVAVLAPSSEAKDAGYSTLPKTVRDIHFERYYDVEALYAAMKVLHAAYPKASTLESMGKSREGRELLVMTIFDPATGDPHRKPAMYVDGNTHGNEVQASEVCLWIVKTLLTRNDAWTKSLLRHVTFYVAPCVNPDSRHRFFHTPQTPHSPRGVMRPVDNDRDGLIDEDGPDDLDGDGHILQMRIKDPDGDRVVDEHDDRLMRRTKAGEKGTYRMLGREGRDDDQDGLFNEDGEGSVDPNRNWPGHWRPNAEQRGAGPYPLSEPETRATALWMLGRPHIAGVQSFHNAGRMILRPPAAFTDKEAGLLGADKKLYEELQQRGLHILPTYRALQIREDLYRVYGGFVDWTYFDLGIFSFTNELWGDLDYERPYDDNESSVEKQRARLKWNDHALHGGGFERWREIDHPDLGKVEVGGWKRFTVRSNPVDYLQNTCARNGRFALEHAASLPRVSMTIAAVKDDPTAWDVTLTNDGLLPTIGAMAKKHGVLPPDRIRMSGAKIVAAVRRKTAAPSTPLPVERGVVELEGGVPSKGRVMLRVFVEGDVTGASLSSRLGGEIDAAVDKSTPADKGANEGDKGDGSSAGSDDRVERSERPQPLPKNPVPNPNKPVGELVDTDEESGDSPWFTNIAADVGLGDAQAKGCVLTDLNGDGYWDLCLDKQRFYLSKKGEKFTPHEKHGIEFPVVNHVPLGKDGKGNMAKAKERPHVPQYLYFADVNNDGNQDALWGVHSSWDVFTGRAWKRVPECDHGLRSRVYLGDGNGGFKAGPTSEYTSDEKAGPAMALAIVDVDGDGVLDLYEGREYRQYGVLYGCGVDRLFAGDGKGGFKDRTNQANLETRPEPGTKTSSRPSYGVTHCDYNNDGHQDLLQLAYGRQWNYLWKNNGDGTFTDVGHETNFAGDAITHGKYPRGNKRRPEQPFRSNGNTFDCAVGDVDNDGDMDLFLGCICHRWAGEASDLPSMLWNEGEKNHFKFRRETVVDLLPKREFRSPNWNYGDLHVAFADIDNDTRLDLLIGSGDYPDGQFLRCYRQKEDGKFEEVTVACGFNWEGCGALSIGDIDRDGDVDIVAGRSLQRLNKAHREKYMGGLEKGVVGIFRNDINNGNHWLNVRLRGKGKGGSNRSGIGARILVTTGEVTQMREIRCGSGLSNHQDPPEACFGLGKATKIDKLEVRWPGKKSKSQVFKNVPVDRFLEIAEGSGKYKVMK